MPRVADWNWGRCDPGDGLGSCIGAAWACHFPFTVSLSSNRGRGTFWRPLWRGPVEGSRGWGRLVCEGELSALSGVVESVRAIYERCLECQHGLPPPSLTVRLSECKTCIKSLVVVTSKVHQPCVRHTVRCLNFEYCKIVFNHYCGNQWQPSVRYTARYLRDLRSEIQRLRFYFWPVLHSNGIRLFVGVLFISFFIYFVYMFIWVFNNPYRHWFSD